MNPTTSRIRPWLLQNAPSLALGAVLLAAAVLLLVLSTRFTFYQDTWAFLMDRRSFSADSLLKPHNEHIVLIPVLLQQLQLAAFGMTSAAPEYVLLTLMLLVTAILLFIYVRRRVSAWLALIFASLLLFLGPAWETLLWPFEICFVGSMLFGIAMLLALERDDHRGDVAACGFLALSIGFNSLGLAFVAAAAVDVFQHRKDRGFRRSYLVVVPLCLYLVWYLGWGNEAGGQISLRNVLGAPLYMLESFAASLEALLGLSSNPVEGAGTLEWGKPLVIAFFCLLALGQWLKRGFYTRLWPVAAAAFLYWALSALNHSAAREPTTSRYLYAGGAMVLLIVANLLKDVGVGRRALIATSCVAVAAIASNLVVLDEGADKLHLQAVLTKADLGAIEIARRTIDSRFVPAPDTAGTGSLVNVEAGKYLPAVDEYGSPAYTPAEISNAEAPGPRQADIILAQALPIETVTHIGEYPGSGRRHDCLTLPRGGTSPASELRITPGATQIEVAPGKHAAFNLRRFTRGEYPVATEGAPGRSTTELRIPLDLARQPWYLQVVANQQVRVCD